MNIEQAIGEELRACRRRKQISQEQLGFDAVGPPEYAVAY